MIGKTLSHYKILEKIGQGGMGEVYRAEDTNLGREVAIKVLPEQFTKDPQRLARFEREAKLLASLNHPNIAAIYGLEEAEGIRFLSLELVPGETLAERVAKGPLPVDKALEICGQIAEGVEAAHEKGVIHRDLKPANVKITPEGKVKILDFGLAKALEEEMPVSDISQSPTLTEEMTRAGVILGTAAYMSPEQARGKPVDKKADIFAFGCVLYELLTAKKAFGGETVTDTLAKVLEGEPQWEMLPRSLPTAIRFLLRRCMQKDPGKRLQHIDGARILIEEALAGAETASAMGLSMAGQRSRWKQTLTLGLVGLAGMVIGVTIWNLVTSVPSTQDSVSKLVITPSRTAPLSNSRGTELAISPDGRLVVYRVNRAGTTQLYRRSLDALEATPIPGTEGAEPDPFFSHDGLWVGFYAADVLKKASLTGGPAMTVWESADSIGFDGGSWGAEDTIVFATGAEGLYRISAAGGEPENLAVPDPEKGDARYESPEILPGGKAVLFTIQRLDNSYQAAVLSLETGEQKVVVEGSRTARFAATGHLVYEAERTGALVAVPFDPDTLEVTGAAISLLEGVRHHSYPFAAVDYSFSGNGTLIYIPMSESREHSLLWVDHQGTEQLITQEKHDYATPRISPDGRQVAFTIFSEGEQNVWIYDLEGDSFRRLTFEGRNGSPSWSPDGRWIIFQSNQEDGRALYRLLADGSGAAEQLTEKDSAAQMTNSWSPDGSALTFHFSDPDTGSLEIWLLPLDGEGEPRMLYPVPGLQCCSKFSPDGQWLAYVSEDAGQSHVYVSPYREPDVKWLASGQEGGMEPVWSPDGSQLYYRSGDRMMVVSVETEPTFNASRPGVLFEGSYWGTGSSPAPYQYYDISPDGERFLMIKEAGQEEAQINVIQNWFEELRDAGN